MALVTNNAEGGTNGTTVTTGNSGGGSGTALTVAIGSGATLTYDNAVVAHGGLSYKLVPASATTTTMIWTISATQIAVRFYVYLDTLPGAVIRLCDIRNAAGTIIRVQTTASNTVQVQEGGTGTPVQMTTAALSAATWYRFEIVISLIAAGTGAYTCDYYLGDQATSLQGINASNGQLGTTAVSFVEFGSIASSTATSTVHFDDLGYNDGSTAYLGPVQSALLFIARRVRSIPPFRRKRFVQAVVQQQVLIPYPIQAVGSQRRRYVRPARRAMVLPVPAQAVVPTPAITFSAIPRRIRGMYRRQHVPAIPVAQQTAPPTPARRVPRRPAPPKRRRQSAIHVHGQTAPPLLARRTPRRPPLARHIRQTPRPFPAAAISPAFIRQAVNRKVRWITAKLRRTAPTQWPQSVFIPPPVFEWEGEWLVGIVDREWIVGNPDIDPSGLR